MDASSLNKTATGSHERRGRKTTGTVSLTDSRRTAKINIGFAGECGIDVKLIHYHWTCASFREICLYQATRVYHAREGKVKDFLEINNMPRKQALDAAAHFT